MNFAQRLKSLRIEQNFTQKELGQAIGVSTISIQCWERGERKPSMDALVSLGKTLQISIDELLGIEQPSSKHSFVLSQGEKNLLRDYQILDSYGKKAVRAICTLEKERMERTAPQKATANIIDIQQIKLRERYIPHYATPSAAGMSVPLDGDEFEMLLVDDSVPEQADYAVNIQGNSMSPYIQDGEVVYVEKDAQLRVGDVGIFCVDGAMYCKMYYLDNEGNLQLVSANPALRHTNVFVSSDSSCDIRCCGRVLLDCKTELPDYLFMGTNEETK